MSAQSNEKGHEQYSDDPVQNEWLCIMCKAQQERVAEDNLKRQGFTVYLPTAPNKSRKQDRVATDIKAMFPGYLFVEAELERQDLSVIRSTFGCIAFLRHGCGRQWCRIKLWHRSKKLKTFCTEDLTLIKVSRQAASTNLWSEGFNGQQRFLL